MFGFKKKKNLIVGEPLETPTRGKRESNNPVDDACNMSKEDIRKSLYKQLRSTCDYITLDEIKYRKIDADCWQCETTGVNYSDNIMNMIIEDFEDKSNIMANYSLYKVNNKIKSCELLFREDDYQLGDMVEVISINDFSCNKNKAIAIGQQGKVIMIDKTSNANEIYYTVDIPITNQYRYTTMDCIMDNGMEFLAENLKLIKREDVK